MARGAKGRGAVSIGQLVLTVSVCAKDPEVAINGSANVLTLVGPVQEGQGRSSAVRETNEEVEFAHGLGSHAFTTAAIADADGRDGRNKLRQEHVLACDARANTR